jgi:RNA polymerase sigma-B factor
LLKKPARAQHDHEGGLLMSDVSAPSVGSALTAFPSREERATRTAQLLEQRARTTDDQARADLNAELVDVNRAVAVALARRYRGRGVAIDDLCQTAFEGLTKAVMRFDSDLAEDLLTFAVPTIRGELLRHFRDYAWTVRPPRRIQELQQEVTAAAEELRGRLGHEPTCQEIAAYLSADESAVAEALRASDCFQPLSLTQPSRHGAELTIADVLTADDDWNDLADARASLLPAVRRLSERERRVLYLRFFEDFTQEQIGAELGVSQMQVSRLLTRILGQLRTAIA